MNDAVLPDALSANHLKLRELTDADDSSVCYSHSVRRMTLNTSIRTSRRAGECRDAFALYLIILPLKGGELLTRRKLRKGDIPVVRTHEPTVVVGREDRRNAMSRKNQDEVSEFIGIPSRKGIPAHLVQAKKKSPHTNDEELEPNLLPQQDVLEEQLAQSDQFSPFHPTGPPTIESVLTWGILPARSELKKNDGDKKPKNSERHASAKKDWRLRVTIVTTALHFHTWVITILPISPKN